MRRFDASIFCLAVAAATLSAPAFAGAQTETATDEIVVTARRAPQSINEVASAVSVVGPTDIRDGRATLGLDESLNRVPGVFIQNSGNYAQDARVQVRGFGTRAAFGVREVRVLIDRLPETLPDGQTQLDEIDLDAIDRIEVLRGPAASLYGNASGGVIQLFSQAPPRNPTFGVRLLGGSYGLSKFTARAGLGNEKARIGVHASHLQVGGYRDHSATEVTTLKGKLEIDPLENTTITTLIDAVDSPKGDDPGALTRVETKSDPTAANPANERFQAGEKLQQGRIGWLLDHHSGANSVFGYGYLLYRDFENSLAFANGGVVTFNRFSPGGGLRYGRDFSLLNVDLTANVGVDVQWQDDNRRRYDNVSGERGALNLDQRERVLGVGPYTLLVLELSEQIELSVGARYDRVDYDVDVKFDSSGQDNSGSTSFDAWSPAGSLRYSPLTWTTLYANVGTTFQVPTTTELAVPNRSGLDQSLDPQTAISYELGFRMQHERDLSAGVAAFRLDVDDELIPFETAPGRTDFRNAGQSRRYGVELDWQAQLLEPLRWTGAFTWIDAEFRDYRVSEQPDAVFDGNQEPGIPPWQLFLELLYRHRTGAFAGIEAFLVDEYFVDDRNSARTREYQVVNVRAGWELRWGRFELTPFVAVNNLTNEDYDGTVRINARNGRFFEPAPRLNLAGGVSLQASL